MDSTNKRHKKFAAHVAIVPLLASVSKNWEDTHTTSTTIAMFLSNTYFPENHAAIIKSFTNAMDLVGLGQTPFVSKTITDLTEQMNMGSTAAAAKYAKAHDTLLTQIGAIDISTGSVAVTQLRTLLTIADLIVLPKESVKALHVLALSKADGLKVTKQKFIKYPLRALKARIVTDEHHSGDTVDSDTVDTTVAATGTTGVTEDVIQDAATTG